MKKLSITENSVMISIRVPESLNGLLVQNSISQGVKKSLYVRSILEKALAETRVEEIYIEEWPDQWEEQ